MTAANVFARADGAWLFFDTAVFDDDGFVRGFRSKVVTSDRLLIGIGVCGRIAPTASERISDYMTAQPDQSAALATTPELLATLKRDAASVHPAPASRWERLLWRGAPSDQAGAISILIGWWDGEEDCGRAGVITDVDDLGPDYPPFQLHEIRNMASPSPQFGDWFDYDDALGMGLDFQPERDGETLAGFERREPNSRGGYRVGGSFERFHIHAGGIDRATVASWPDRIGRPIKVTA